MSKRELPTIMSRCQDEACGWRGVIITDDAGEVLSAEGATFRCPGCGGTGWLSHHRKVDGVGRIQIERERQKYVEGHDDAHDDTHTKGDLSVYAAALAVEGTDARVDDPVGRVCDGHRHDGWGLLAKHGDDRVRCLEIAGALIAAELDRELRLRKRLADADTLP